MRAVITLACLLLALMGVQALSTTLRGSALTSELVEAGNPSPFPFRADGSRFLMNQMWWKLWS
jgi:hypothetical protein